MPPPPPVPPPQGRYTPEWRHHVLSHLPFYTILLPKFLELTYGRLGYRSDAAVMDALLVLEVCVSRGRRGGSLHCRGICNPGSRIVDGGGPS